MSCAERGLGDPCVDILFMWAALWREHLESADPVMQLVRIQCCDETFEGAGFWSVLAPLKPRACISNAGATQRGAHVGQRVGETRGDGSTLDRHVDAPAAAVPSGRLYVPAVAIRQPSVCGA